MIPILNNKKISLDAILLFVLVNTVLNFFFSGLPVKQLTFYWVFSFILMFVYLLLDFKPLSKYQFIGKLIIIINLICFLAFAPVFSEMFYRTGTEQSFYSVHDGILQVEEGIKFLLEGKNPYRENYHILEKQNDGLIGTSLGDVLINPAIYHFVALPWHLIFSVPFYWVSHSLFNWYDQRIVFLLLYFLSLIIIYHIPKRQENKLLFLIIFVFNPLFLTNFIGGTNDILVFTWVLLSLYLLKIKKIKLSALILGLAVLSKHSAWPLIPFYFLYLWFGNNNQLRWQKIKDIFYQTYPFFIVSIVFFGFFLIWDTRAFIEDIYLYLAGNLPTSYPINGFGFSALIFVSGFVTTQTAYFPFWILQLIFILPLVYFLFKLQRRTNTLSQVIFNYSLTLFVFWFFSRFFHFNYIGYLTLLIISAYFFNDTQE
jgi:hypothetical protein